MATESERLLEDYCLGCVYYPPNLPPDAYAAADWHLLKDMACSLEHTAGGADCQASRKTSCSLVDLSDSSLS